jgi:hypothetical protein
MRTVLCDIRTLNDSITANKEIKKLETKLQPLLLTTSPSVSDLTSINFLQPYLRKLYKEVEMDFTAPNQLYQERFTKDYTSISDDTSNPRSFINWE